MDNTIITKLSNLEAHDVEQTVALWVDSFYPMLKGISKEREKLCRLFMPCIQLDLCYVLFQNNQVAGFVAVSNYNTRAIMIHEDACISTFGPLKGKILTWQLRKILSKPAVNKQDQGYIDFIATAPEFKRCGVAQSFLLMLSKTQILNGFIWMCLHPITRRFAYTKKQAT